MDAEHAIELLQGLVSVPSLSGDEAEAAAWLVAQMDHAGFQRAYVDEAGNAVGEIGLPDAPHTILLLGHIDTVPGDIEVRIEESAEGARLFGRGSVDAKGPLACFTAATARLGADFAAAHDLRVIVVGAVEEESASSKGARHIRSRFDGVGEPIPDACVIGEPSRWHRMTLGYKGRLLVELDARREMTHTAGPEAGVTTAATGLWNLVEAFASEHNYEIEKAFDQVLPSLRSIRTESDGLDERVQATIGLRLPPNFETGPLLTAIQAWASGRAGVELAQPPRLEPGQATEVVVGGNRLEIRLHYRGYETAWRSDRGTPLVRSFMAAVRSVGDTGTRPGILVKTGTSDMNVVGPAWQCPILAYGPGDSALDHTPNEHIYLDEYTRAIDVLTTALQNLSATLVP